MRRIIVLLLLMALSSVAVAADLTNVDVLSDIVDDEVFVTIAFDLQSETCVSEQVIPIPLFSEVLTVYALGQQPTYVASDSTVSLLFSPCVQDTNVFVRLRSPTPVGFTPDTLRYVFSLPLDVPYTHTVVLPEWANASAILEVTPKEYIIDTDDLVVVSWEQAEGQTYIVSLLYDAPMPMWTVWLIVFGSLLVAGGIYALIHYRFVLPHKREREIRDMLKKCDVLQDKEQKLMREVISHPGIYQHTLLKKLDLLKSNGSKVISKLEQRGLLERRKMGKINALYPGERLKNE